MGILADWQIEQGNFIKPCEPGMKRPGIISYGVSSYGYDARIGYRFKVFNNAYCGEIDPKNFDPKNFTEIDLSKQGEHEWVIEKGRATGHCKHCGILQWSISSFSQEPCTTRQDGTFVRIPPNSFVLGESIEDFDIPRDTLAICLGKSTYARCGLVVNVTPLEPEWRGKVTIEISNTTPLPARVYAGEGIMQVLFFRAAGYGDAVREIYTTMVRDLGTGRPKDKDGGIDYNHWSWVQWKAYEQAMNSLTDLVGSVECRQSYANKAGKYQNQSQLTLPTVDR